MMLILTTIMGCSKQTSETKNAETQPDSEFCEDHSQNGIGNSSGDITYEAKNVEISLNSEFCKDFLPEFGIGRFSGDITYKAKKEISLQEESRCMFDCDDNYCPDEDEMEYVTFFPVDSMGNKLDYAITSYDNGGFKLAVKASISGSDTYFKRYLYDNITLIHPLYMPHDSVVCSNLRFEGYEYGIGGDFYDSRPCAGKIKVYRVDGDEKYLSKEMVEASDERTVWKEYDPYGNVKSIKTITHNPQEIDEYGFAAEPFVTKTKNYHEDRIKNNNENDWIYGTWRCSTPYGTIEIILQANGRMYDGIEQRWCNYTIEGNRIIEQLNHGISSYNIDRANKRFDCGEPGYWFTKVK